MRIVINRCYGGFGLSVAALHYLAERGSPLTHRSPVRDYFAGKEPTAAQERDLSEKYALCVHASEVHQVLDNRSIEFRSHADLVAVVAALGDAASDNLAKLEVVEIPDGVPVHLEEDRGKEWVVETGRRWPPDHTGFVPLDQ